MERGPRPDDHLVEPLFAGLGAGEGGAAPAWWRRLLGRLAALLRRSPA